MSEATLTIRVDEKLKNEFSSAAKSRDRTGAQLLRDFMRDFVRQQQEASEHDAWFQDQVQVGLNAANAGEVISAEEVEAEAAIWRAEMRRKQRTEREKRPNARLERRIRGVRAQEVKARKPNTGGTGKKIPTG